MKKLLIVLLLILLSSCAKITTVDKPIYKCDYELAAIKHGDTTWYYRIIGSEGKIVFIDSVYTTRVIKPNYHPLLYNE